MPKVVINTAPVDNLQVDMEVGGVTKSLTLRVFSITDEAWLANYLAGRELFMGKDSEAFRAAAAFYHQLDNDSRAAFAEAVGLETDVSNGASEDWDDLGHEMCDKLPFTQLEPIVQTLIVLRERSLPDVEEVSAGGSDAPVKKRWLFWTLMCASLCANFVLVLMLFTD